MCWIREPDVSNDPTGAVAATCERDLAGARPDEAYAALHARLPAALSVGTPIATPETR